MKNLRNRFERFCFTNRSKGIPNLMLYITIGNALVYFFTVINQNAALYNLLCFNRELILRGQVWRLFTYVLTSTSGSVVSVAIGLFCYYMLGRNIEHLWGTCRFNLYYLTGVILMDVFCMLFGGFANASYLNLSLFLAYATMFPNAHFLLFFIIPIKAWIFAVVYLGLILYDVINLCFPHFMFPYNVLPLVSLANYFLFFGKDFLNIIPLTWKANAKRLVRKKSTASSQEKPKVIPFPKADSHASKAAAPQTPYTHRCTICGRTDVTNPELEFRYCSRCNGYYCYCEEHISNHTHIQ